MSGEMTRKEIPRRLEASRVGATSRSNIWMPVSVKKGWIEMTMPEKPRSPNQRFRITPVGRACVEAFEDE